MLHNEYRSLIRPGAPHYLSRSECENERGLVHGIQDVGNAIDYSTSMIINDAAGFLKDNKHMYNCASVDANGKIQECSNNPDNVIKEAANL